MSDSSHRPSNSPNPPQNEKKGSAHRITAALLLAAVVLGSALLGFPNEPLSLIARARKLFSTPQQLLLPSTKLAGSLGIGACSKADLDALYTSAASFQSAIDGLKLFDAALNKEYKLSAKTFSGVVQKVLSNDAPPSKRPKACLLPFKIATDSTLGSEIASSKLLEVSLNAESIICSEGNAYLITDAGSSSLFLVRQSLADYAAQVKRKHVVRELKAQLAKLQSAKAKGKSAIATKAQRLREVSLAIAYAQYFSKDSLLLGSFYDSLCARTAAIATPAAETTIATPCLLYTSPSPRD